MVAALRADSLLKDKLRTLCHRERCDPLLVFLEMPDCSSRITSFGFLSSRKLEKMNALLTRQKSSL
jgi:hypothetical protein